MKSSAIILTIAILISGCSKELLEYNDLEFGLSKSEILEKYGDPISIRDYRVPAEDDPLEIGNIPGGEIWSYPARRTYDISTTRIERRNGVAELYFSASGRWNINQLGAYGWVSEEVFASRESAKDT